MDEATSKSQMKREAEALQALGLKLLELSQEQLDSIPLSELLKSALLEAKRLKSHGAIRRQAQLIGKLMRTEQSEAIFQRYQEIINLSQTHTAAFHRIEQWREDLLTKGKDALTQFLQHYPQADSQHLRQLIKKAVQEQQKPQEHHSSRALFRYIKSLLCAER